MSAELRAARDHARRMAAGRRPSAPLQGPQAPLTWEDRKAWERIAEEADAELRRQALASEDGALFEVEPDPEQDVPLF